MLLLRMVGLGLALIQVTLGLRLVLPFARIPEPLERFVPTLVTVSDWLMAPFESFTQPFELDEQLGVLPGGVDLGFGDYLDRFDPAILVAMVGWGIVGAFALFVLRLVIRPG